MGIENIGRQIVNHAVGISAKYSKIKDHVLFHQDVPAKIGSKTLKIEAISLKNCLKCMKKIKSLVSFEILNFVIKTKLFSSYFLLVSVFLDDYSATVPFENAIIFNNNHS